MKYQHSNFAIQSHKLETSYNHANKKKYSNCNSKFIQQQHTKKILNRPNMENAPALIQ